MATMQPIPTGVDRVNFDVTYEEPLNFGLKIQQQATIESVKTYGHIWGRFLTFLGYASKTETGIYVNRRNFFQHLAEAWYKAHGQEKQILEDKTLIPRLVKIIEEDEDLDPSFLTANKVSQIFKICQQMDKVWTYGFQVLL